jgi:hypothetical protein
LYINRGSFLHYSEDNGSTFTSISLPQDGGPFQDNFMYLLDNDIIFMSYRLSTDCYYTLNNGQDWILANISFPLTQPYIKLVNNHILAVELKEYTASRINTTTNEVVTEQLGNSFDLVLGAIILDDGTVYIPSLYLFSENVSLYRYRFGEGVKFLGYFNEMLNARLLAGVGKDLFAFTLYSYYIFDGETIEQHDCVGLPDPYSSWSFTLSDNNTVYTIIDYN